ncbi:MAG: hypothetical protein GWM92_08185 [Gemmatimonadetes bacterium]|nr:hypothetical protein [Gemmatimonadota bacterium]NIR78621.1 hypothetical protein [Gemmatimonadota bacterium]NIT87239.1 hypothetical protein [Gemmatimonadota bacterium]NIU31082.1 hypothetical protein [Gemmatimonadota bacterium]NIU35818.1 hypothetical protein [Gemmatimonadota bacterium]
MVASILVAFALDAWWDARGEVAAELEILEALRDEFSEADTGFRFARDVTGRVLRASEGLYETLEASRSAGVAAVPDTLLLLALIAPTTDLGLGTLEGLRMSGRIQTLTNLELRRALSTWKLLLEEAVEEERRSRRLVTEQLAPVLRRSVSLGSAWVGEEEFSRVEEALQRILELLDGAIEELR